MHLAESCGQYRKANVEIIFFDLFRLVLNCNKHLLSLPVFPFAVQIFPCWAKLKIYFAGKYSSGIKYHNAAALKYKTSGQFRNKI